MSRSRSNAASERGVLAGFAHEHCGAVWLDAHADFNTPESTTSGFFAGMSAAIICGHCYRDYWAQVGDNRPLAEDTIAMFGIREVSPQAERERPSSAPPSVWSSGRMDIRTRTFSSRSTNSHGVCATSTLHIDFDAFAPELAPGIVDEPVPGGLTLEQATTIIRATAERFRIQAATLATYAPSLDQDNRTSRLALSLLGLLAEYARSLGSSQGRGR